MKFAKTSMIILITMMLAIALASCSGSSKNQSPIELSFQVSDLQSSLSDGDHCGRSILAVYDVLIDPDVETVMITPSERIAAYHFPLSQSFPNVLKIIGYGWTPNFWVDIRLTHPFPGSGIDAFDPRVIAILPANSGVSCFYPVFNVLANNKTVMEPDGYTPLWDNLGIGIVGTNNPFKAYFKSESYRRWSSTGVTSETQRWNIDLAGFGGPVSFYLVVDVSTNYPAPSSPVTDNASEPVEITASIGNGLTYDGGSADIEVTFLDWQGQSDIKCKVEAPALFNSAIQLFYSRPGTNLNEYIFRGVISNELLAPAGEYSILIAAWDIPTNVHIYDEVIATVSDEITFDPVDVTPSWLSFSPIDIDIFIVGNYAYIAEYSIGLGIMNISDPVNPVLVNLIDTPGIAFGVHVSDGYAYIADGEGGLQIINVDPPESASIVKTVELPGKAYHVYVSGGYAYVTDLEAGLQIIDIEPLGNAHIVKTIDTPGDAYAVQTSAGYAYVANWTSGLCIIDVEPPEDAYIVNPLGKPRVVNDIYVSGGYAYVADDSAGLQIMDIEPPESAHQIKTIDTSGFAYGIYVSDGYAYVGDGSAGLQIIDIEPLEFANVVATVDTSEYAYGVYTAGGFAYVADCSAGLKIIDIEPPESANIVRNVELNGVAYRVCVSGGYAYVANWIEGLQIIDIEPPESAYIVMTIDAGIAYDVKVSGGYAYVVNFFGGLRIVDIEPLKSASIVKTVGTPGYSYGCDVSNGYAYVTDTEIGLQIIDIVPPESAYIVTTVDTPGIAYGGVHVSDGYAYMGGSDGIRIIKLW